MVKLGWRGQYGFFILLMALLSLGQLQRVQVTPFIALYLHDVLIALWSAVMVIGNAAMVAAVVKENWRRLVAPVPIVLLAIFIVGWVLAGQKGQLSLEVVLLTGRLVMYLGWAMLCKITRHITNSFWQFGFIVAGLLVAFFGLLQYAFIPDTRFLSILGWDDHYYRLISTVFDPNFTGLLLVITFLWLLGLPIKWWHWLIHFKSSKQEKVLPKFMQNFLSVILLICLGLTFSRASYLSLLVGLVLFFGRAGISRALAYRSTLVILVVGTVLTLSGLALITTGEGTNLLRTRSIQARLTNSQYWLTSMAPYEWILGRGFMVAPAETRMVQTGISADTAQLPDNLVILLLSGVGIVGLALVVAILYQNRQFLPVSSCTQAILAAVLTHSMFNNSLLQPFILLFVLGKLVGDSLTNGTKP